MRTPQRVRMTLGLFCVVVMPLALGAQQAPAPAKLTGVSLPAGIAVPVLDGRGLRARTHPLGGRHTGAGHATQGLGAMKRLGFIATRGVVAADRLVVFSA